MIRKTLLFALLLLSFSSAAAHVHATEAVKTDTLEQERKAIVERWEYKTLYVHNTHVNARQGEAAFKAHADAETLNRHGREGWELVAVTPVIAEPMGNNRATTQMLVYTFKRRLTTPTHPLFSVKP